MSGRDDVDDRRRYNQPYTHKHTIPTIQKYREEKDKRREQAGNIDEERGEDGEAMSRKETAERYWHRERHDDGQEQPVEEGEEDAFGGADEETRADTETPQDTSQVDPNSVNPKARRKAGKKHKAERMEREVTDPVTHLPVRIFDFTDEALEEISENEPPHGSTPETYTGFRAKAKVDEQLQKELDDMRKGQKGMNQQFPPPNFVEIRKDLEDIEKKAFTVGLVGVGVLVFSILLLERLLVRQGHSFARQSITWTFLGIAAVGGLWAVAAGVRHWLSKRINSVWDDEVWDADRSKLEADSSKHDAESVRWLNSLLGSVWPLINPDLFVSLADTLEDVMQASLPRLVRMVSVDDIGQGSEPIRILGVRWLPTAAAARSVGGDGKLRKASDGGHNDRTVPGEGEVEEDVAQSDEKSKEGSGKVQAQAVAEGMEAEDGDFINLEVAFAYRARSDKKTVASRMKDMHLYLAFYLPGNLKLPIWVDLKGVVGTMRMRLQLTPDPPFFALCTMTFLGQPKVQLSCQPLFKKMLNIMDLPLISQFVQSSVDAAMAEYVAPKSISLDLKDMLAGDDFKKDTISRGVVVITIVRGYDFKCGDAGIPLIKEATSDPYISVGWAKFGKALWSTRLLMNEMNPVWEETAYLLVSPEELNVNERLRLQLWDSDRFTADDDLGRIEVDLKHLMKSEQTNGKMHKRCDGFRALKKGEDMPGKLEWNVGYFSKTRIQDCQLQQQTFDPEVRTMAQLRDSVDKACEKKLREAFIKGDEMSRDDKEVEQQKAQELKERQDQMIISAPPPDGYPSGIFSIQIHQITGLELEKLSKGDDSDDIQDEEQETGDSLPSAYCNVIINHRKVFKTRTKPQNAKPFYNAGTERFIADWQNAEVHIGVRDARVHEDDPLLGIVHLNLGELFKERSQVNGFFPLAGGVGFGRMRLSMVWRSVQLQAPPEAIGWEIGTLEVKPEIEASDIPDELKNLRLKLSTSLGSGKMYPSKKHTGWSAHRHAPHWLAVEKRYSTCLSIRFRDKKVLGGHNAAFAVLWLRDIPDEEDREVELTVWKGDFKRAIACSLDEPGTKVGTIKLKLKFWSGLGQAHSSWANKDPDLKNVMEVLETARDNLNEEQAGERAGVVHNESDTESHAGRDDDDSSTDDDSDNEHRKRSKGDTKNGDEDAHKDSQGFIDQYRERRRDQRAEHRRHRGVMQFRIPRTARWAMHKGERVQDKVAGIFKHHTREPGIETEV
ncbi:hypothetical protein Q7P35_011859 [Cladosporium inversicolor]